MRRMKTFRSAFARVGTVVAVALALSAPLTTASAQPLADTFRGKTLKILIPSVPGGDRALYGLAFAGYFGKHVPGNPTIQPIFMPGAGGSTAVNNAYGMAAPDGLTIVTPLAAVVMAQAVGDDSVKYDVGKFNWIGRITDATRVFLVSSKVDAKTIDDFRKREVIIASVARASETYMLPAFINKVFGTKFKIVTGYQAAGKMNLAVEAGEADGSFSTWNDINSYHPEWIRDGKMRIIVQIALRKHPDLANVPLLLDYAENDADRELIAFMSSGQEMGQSYAAPPGTPAPVLAALRKAFDDTMRDPAFIEKVQIAKMQFNPIGGEELTRVVARTIGAPKSVIDRYKAAVAGD
jgi:tripartite-type tricarboxylate transporter receptor subunit TctC